MLYTNCEMADQVGKCNITNSLVLENAFSVSAVKEEECQQGDFIDDKVQISETSINVDNTDLQGNLICDEMKQYDISTILDKIKTELPAPKVQYDMPHDNLKVEGISPDDIKIELNNGSLYCEDCQVYCEDYCAKCEMLVHILNKTVTINADKTSRPELPNNILEIQDCLGESHVFALKSIPVGVRFGPFTGLNRTEHSWIIKGGKFVVNKDKSAYLNWMQYINPAKNISEQNLLAFQHEGNLYYQSTRQIQQGNELLVHFGEEYEDSTNRNVEMDFIATSEHIFKDAFACTFCCLGLSSKLHLSKHKAICPGNVDGRFSVEELTRCPSCKIHLDQREYILHHMPYCSKINDRKCVPPTMDERREQVTGATRQIYKCKQCKYRTKYKAELNNHTNHRYQVKMYKCGICSKRFKTKEILKLHVKNIHDGADGKNNLEHSTGVYMNVHAQHSRSQNEMKVKCSIGEIRTKYKTSLKNHLVEKHFKKCNYKYDTGDYKANWKFNLNPHIEGRHLHEIKYKCDTCDYKANRKSQLQRNIEIRHLKVFKYACVICDYKTYQKSNLKSHIGTKHLKEFKYKCDICDFKTNLRFHLKRHIEARHLKEFKYKCDICDYKTYQKFNLKSHVEAKHLKEFKHACDVCDYKTNLKVHLKAHIERRHLKIFKYKCSTCDYKANKKCQLKDHVETRHLKVFKYKCVTCDYKTNQKPSLNAHIQTKHLKEFEYKCDECDYKTNHKPNLKTHITAKHLKGFEYECDTCDYKTNQKLNLKTHIETKHLKEFKYKCDTCDYKTYRRRNLTIHVQTKHFKEFKYKCNTCDFKSYQKSKLNRHIDARHSKILNYNCDSCDYKTYLKDYIKKHIETKHLKKFKYKCDVCDYETNWKSNFDRHIDGRHN